MLSIIPIIVCGIPILIEVVKDAKNKEISAEALVLMALIGCVILQEYIAAAEVAIIMAIGELLETIVTTHARSGMDSLGRLKVSEVNLLIDGKVSKVAVNEVPIGSIIRIFPGETVPLDGIVIDGDSSIDKSMMTGESIPVDVMKGDEVFAGTSNLYGSIDVEVTRTDEDSMLSRMAELLENADADKSKMVNTADRWAKWILLGAAIITILTYLYTRDVYRALTIMVVFCPCAFVLATPTGIMAAAGNMAKKGILLRDASAIEGMNGVDTILFDKTGTLTTGNITSLGFTAINTECDTSIIEGMSSSLESRSEHPLGRAIARDHTPMGTMEDFRNIPGQGVMGIVNGHRMAIGNKLLMQSQCSENLEDVINSIDGRPFTTVLVGMDGRTIGYFALEDRVKEDSATAINELRDLNVKTIMLTGDSRMVGSHVAERLGMDDVVWECLPETKLKVVSSLEEKGNICMIGDGMNDAPSLKRATVGISMGSMGNDLAVGSSDVMIMNDDIGRIPGLVRLCRRSVRTIIAGLTLSMTINIIGVILGIVGTIGPIEGAIIHNLGSFFVILLAASLLWADVWNQKIAS